MKEVFRVEPAHLTTRVSKIFLEIAPDSFFNQVSWKNGMVAQRQRRGGPRWPPFLFWNTLFWNVFPVVPETGSLTPRVVTEPSAVAPDAGGNLGISIGEYANPCAVTWLPRRLTPASGATALGSVMPSLSRSSLLLTAFPSN